MSIHNCMQDIVIVLIDDLLNEYQDLEIKALCILIN